MAITPENEIENPLLDPNIQKLMLAIAESDGKIESEEISFDSYLKELLTRASLNKKLDEQLHK